jgi:uncharacterized delta-60 repeat protein
VGGRACGTITTHFAGADDRAAALAVKANGRLVAAGTANTAGPFSFNQDFALTRYNHNGSLDTSFGTGGKVTTDSGTVQDQAAALAVQTDGKMVAAGTASGDFALARYNPDGSPDASFGTGGKVTTDFSGFNDQAQALTVQPDGKLAAAGRAQVTGDNTDFALARYNPDGTLDTSFGADKVTTDFARPGGGFDEADALVVQGKQARRRRDRGTLLCFRPGTVQGRRQPGLKLR